MAIQGEVDRNQWLKGWGMMVMGLGSGIEKYRMQGIWLGTKTGGKMKGVRKQWPGGWEAVA